MRIYDKRNAQVIIRQGMVNIMKKVLFLLKSITTHNQQDALCVEKVAEHLKSYGISVEYLSWELTPVTDYSKDIHIVVEDDKRSGIANWGRKITKVICTPIENISAEKKLYHRLVALYSSNQYDAVIAVINPPENAEAVYMAKKKFPKMHTILYELDPNSSRHKVCRNAKEKIWRLRSMKWERKIYRSFDHILHMASHERHYSSKYFAEFQKKTIYLDIPNFEPIDVGIDNKLHTPLRLLYCGAFYPRMREPYYMFRLLEEVSKTVPLTLDIYTGNSMRDELEAQSRKKDFLRLHKEVSQEELNSIIGSSDILISVGNKNTDFLPSKTLMYMGTSKPIIHFYYDRDDVSLRYFSCYPAVLSIPEKKENEPEIVKQIIAFIEQVCSGIPVDQNLLRSCLYRNTPEYSAKQIYELINNESEKQ